MPEYMTRGGVTYRIITDHLGSPRLVVNGSTGQIVQQMEYDEFGRVLSDTSPGFQPFGFAGGLYEPTSNLLRFGARDYDAETGRWTAKEPLLFEGGDTNFFSYALGEPINTVDSNGEEPGKITQSNNDIIREAVKNGSVKTREDAQKLLDALSSAKAEEFCAANPGFCERVRETVNMCRESPKFRIRTPSAVTGRRW